MKRKILLNLFVFYFLIGCVDQSSDSVSSSGTGGSTAKFVVQNNFLIVVEDRSIRSFSLNNAMAPSLIDQAFTNGPRLETVFPYGDDLVLVGTNQGAIIVKLNNDGLIEGLSFASHFTSRDPVVAANGYMYVTIRPELNQTMQTDNSGVLTSNRSNRLIVFDIQDVENPIELVQKPIIEPAGLSLAGNRLYVCFANGLRIYDVSEPSDPQQVSEYAEFPCNDVIARPSELIATGDQGIELLDNQQDIIRLLGSIQLGD